MKEKIRFKRPSPDKQIAEQLNVFLQDLLTMNVNDVVGIALETYIRWVRNLKPEEIDQWIQPNLQKYKLDYERLVHSNRRRFIMIIVLSDFLANADFDRSQPRSVLTGWRELNKDETEQFVQQILSWITTLTTNEAFDAILELILRWADQYNAHMAIEFAKFGGRFDADQYTDENITAFLRFSFDIDLELADAQITWHQWAD
jgi:hypothetical protein